MFQPNTFSHFSARFRDVTDVIAVPWSFD